MTTIIPHNESYLFYFRNINIFQIYYNHIFSFANVPPPKYRIEFILLSKDQETRNKRKNEWSKIKKEMDDGESHAKNQAIKSTDWIRDWKYFKH